MRKTKIKFMSLLLAVMMIVGMLPTTAFAAGTPDYVRVYNGNNQITSLSDKQYLAANDATSQSSGYDGTQTYVARYDKSTGTLYLKGYQGVATEDSIFAGGDLNIVVESDSSFTTSTTTTQNLYGIQADSGKLNISGSGKLTVTANGAGNVYGIYAKEGVTISAPLDVTVRENDTTKNGTVYGIYTKSGAISLSGNDMTVTATGGAENAYGVYNAANTSTTIADNGNIAISGKLTVKLSNGKYNRGISSQGGVITLNAATVRIPGNYYYGIYNENGNVIIKNGSDVDISSDISSDRGIATESSGSLTIDKSIVKVSAYGIVAEIYENVSIKDSTVDLTLTDNHYEVIRADSTAANTIDLSGSGSVTLTATGKQDYAMFGGKVTLGTNTKCEKGTAISSWNNYAGEYDAVSNTTVLKFVHESAAPATYTVSFAANGGTGTMADVTGISGEYTLPANGFTAPAGKQFKAWSVGGVEKAAGDKITVTANTTVTAVWEAIEYNVTVTGGTASVGAGTPITKATMGTTVTLTANAAPTDMVFDKWEVISGSITLADANSATTTFTMPAGAVSVKATYTTYITVNLAAGEGSGTMEPIIIKNTYGYFSLTAPECTFTAPANKVFDKWQFSKDDSYLKPGDTKTIWSSADGATLTAIWKDAPVTEYDITVTGGKATVGAGTEITKAAEGTTVTLTANAAPTDMVFDKWEVISGSITLADANSATTTFTMPAGAVSVKATYKNAPHTHTYNQETVKPEALKTPADCTHNAVYFKSCSCGAISTTDTFVAMDTALGHAYGSDWKYDSTNHWHECSRCHDKKYEAAHTAGEWIVDTPATATTAGTKHKECTVCKKVLETATIPATGSSHTHSYGTDWKYDNTNHWHECQCGGKVDIAAHSASEWIIDTAATETAEGAKHKECTVCKKVLETATIPATGSTHTHSGVYVGMTYTAGNLIYQITSIDTATLGQSKVIGVVAAKKNKITKVTIPDRADYKGYRLNVTAVGDNAFKSMKKLKNVTFGSNVKVIGKNAFSNCKKLNKISFKNITTIGNNAFAGCKALKKLTIGNKVTVIGKNAFKDCSKLETVVIGKAVKTISSKAFIGDNKIKEITFKGKKLKTVKKDAFSNKAKKNIKSKKTKLKGNKKAIKLFKKKLNIK